MGHGLTEEVQKFFCPRSRWMPSRQRELTLHQPSLEMEREKGELGQAAQKKEVSEKRGKNGDWRRQNTVMTGYYQIYCDRFSVID